MHKKGKLITHAYLLLLSLFNWLVMRVRIERVTLEFVYTQLSWRLVWVFCAMTVLGFGSSWHPLATLAQRMLK